MKEVNASFARQTRCGYKCLSVTVLPRTVSFLASELRNIKKALTERISILIFGKDK